MIIKFYMSFSVKEQIEAAISIQKYFDEYVDKQIMVK